MRKISLFLLLAVTTFLSKAQDNDPILLTIQDKNVLLSEFNAIFKKKKIRAITLYYNLTLYSLNT